MTSTRSLVLAIALLTAPVFSFSQTSVHAPAGAIRGITFNAASPPLYGLLVHPRAIASFAFVTLAADKDRDGDDKDKDKDKEKKPKKNVHGDEMTQRIAILIGLSAMFGYVLLSRRRSRQRM